MPASRPSRTQRLRRVVPPEAQPTSYAWVELVREVWHRACAYRRLAAELAATQCSEPIVHDFRVAAQRLQAALRLAERLTGTPEPHRLRRDVRRRFHASRRLRDVQVMALGLPRSSRQRPVMTRLRVRLEAEERKLRAHLLRRGGKQDKARAGTLLRSVLRALVAKARASTEAALTGTMRRDLAALQERVAERVARVRGDDLTTLHRLRLAVKRARYALEIVATTHGLPQAKALCRTAQGWQDLLGTIRDLQLLSDELARVPIKGERERAILRVFLARLSRDQTEAVRTLLRQGPALLRFARSIQCLPVPQALSRRRAS